MKRALLFSIGIAFAVQTASADPVGAPCPELTPANQWLPGYQARSEGSPPIASTKARAILALRREGLLLKRRDGGALSDAHRAELQAKLNAIQSGEY